MDDAYKLSKAGQLNESSGENDTKTDFLDHINEIGEIAVQSGGINDLFYEFAAPHLEFLSGRLCLNRFETALLTIIINLYEGEEVTVDCLAKHLHLKFFELMTHMNEFETLEQKGFIRINRANDDFRSFLHEKMSFELLNKTIDILKSGQYCAAADVKNLSTDEFFKQLEYLCANRIQKRQSYKNSITTMNNLLSDYGHLPFAQKINKLELQDDTLFMLLRFFHYTVTLDEPEMSFTHLSALYENNSDFTVTKRQLKNGNHILLTKELIENTCDDGFSDSSTFRLTEAAKEEFLSELDISLPNLPVKGLKLCSSIPEKKLYYPQKTRRAIDELVSLLRPEALDDIQKRLAESGMRTGFACLFSGGPGTGKTETALQIARQSGRDIIQVDIANTKSKWFGESEKQIKSLFDKYRRSVRTCKTTPILLFNEADAVFAKRRIIDENRSGPGQTENAIQNIILQEIENLNGILIATTNLSVNMDAAFERRFLYKIEFEKPKAETRKAIWNSLIAELSDNDAWMLASRYDFSGGQIENISRKSTVRQVLSGKSPSLEEMLEYCDNECSNKSETKKIGFTA